ncbi:TPA: DUF421 domain-containing protein [Legionella pneumophila]|jgi:uncharacterized membrane protein YcaP (DUF421 family)|nr:DUF421 domain-containing protein [Legionella pneumophila]HRD70234.1 DUF421 domain-containing protein [Legionella sp.]
MEFINWLDTDPGYLCAWIRCIILFFMCVLCIRFTNHRFSLNTPLDFLLITISGGLISRGIVGANSLGITIEGFLTLIVLHLVLSKLCFHFEGIGFLLKGSPHYLIENGKLNYQNMKRYSISENDLLDQLRLRLNTENYESIESAFLERTGCISFVTKANHSKKK